MSSYQDLVGYVRQMERRLAALERLEVAGVSDHGALTGLADDDHGQYALLAGRAGGQALSGGNAANEDLTLQGTTHATRTSSYLLLQPNGGNVGIGTAAPGDSLEVAGVVAASGALGALRAYDRANGAAHAFGMYTASNIGRIYSWGKPGDVLAIKEDGHVGIGTSDPSYSLHAEESIAGDGTLAFLKNTNTAAAARSASVLLGTAAYAHTYLRQNGGNGTQTVGGAVDTVLMNSWTTNDNGHLHLGTNNAVQVTVRHGGNVGIGITNPGDKLHVSGGYILLDNDYYYRVKNASGTIIRVAGIDSANNVWMGAIDNAGGKVVIREDGSDVITLHGANVGIGTGTPNGKLQVEGRVGVKSGSNSIDAQMFVYQDSSTAAIAVLDLAQEDLSEEFINFRATVAAGNPIDTAAIGTYYGKARVAVNGTFKYVALYNS